MRTRILLTAAAALFSLTSTAYAAITSGTVRVYMPEEHVLVLENGNQFNLTRVGEQEIAPGDHVRIVYSGIQNGRRVANSVTVVEQAGENTASN